MPSVPLRLCSLTGMGTGSAELLADGRDLVRWNTVFRLCKREDIMYTAARLLLAASAVEAAFLGRLDLERPTLTISYLGIATIFVDLAIRLLLFRNLTAQSVR